MFRIRNVRVLNIAVGLRHKAKTGQHPGFGLENINRFV